MPIGGESVGTAYVRIIADGTGLPRSIRDEMEEVEWDEMGRKGSTKFREAWVKEQEKAPNRRELLDSIAAPLVRGKWLTESFFRGENWTTFRNTLEKEYGAAGKRAAENLERGLYEGMDFDSLRKRLENLTPELVRARQQMEREALEAERKLREDYDRDFEKHLDDQLQARRDMLDEAYRLNKAHDNRNRKMLEEAYRLNAEFDRKQRNLLDEAYRINAQIDRQRMRNLGALRREYGELLRAMQDIERGERGVSHSVRGLQRDIARLRDLLAQTGGNDSLSRELDRINSRLVTMHPNVRRFHRGLDDTANVIGTITGRGSRNNFLNFMGSLTRNFANLLFIVPKVATSLGGALLSALRGGGGLVGAFGQLAGFASRGAVGLVAMAVAGGVLFLALSPVVALMSGLLGIVTALVGSLSFALVGAVGVLAGSLVPLAVGIATVAWGLTQLSKEMQRQVKQDIKPLADAWRDVGRAIGEELIRDVDQWAKTLAPVVRGMKPLMLDLAGAIREVVGNWLALLESPGFKEWRNNMAEVLPSMIATLGEITSNTASALGGMFQAASPAIQDFLGWLAGVTERWSEWANDADGAKQIDKFLRDAGESAKALGDFLGGALELFSELASQGKDTGDSIFTSMGNAMEDFAEHLRENPDALNEWFEHARELATTIGEIILAVGKLLDKLDSPEARTAVTDFADLAGAFLAVGGAVMDTVDKVDRFFNNPWVTNPLQTLADEIVDFFSPGGGFEDALFGLGDIIEGWLPEWLGGTGKGGGISLNTKVITAQFHNLGPKIIKAIGKIDLIDIFKIPGVSSIASAFFGLGGKILRGIGKIKLLSAFKFPSIKDITGFFGGLGGRILKAIGKVVLSKAIDFPKLSKIIGFFTGLGGDILRRIGKVVLMKNIELPKLSKIIGFFTGLGVDILQRIGKVVIMKNIELPSLSKIIGHFAGLGVDILNRIGAIVLSKNIFLPSLAGIAGHFAGLAGRILNAIGTINLSGLISLPNIPGVDEPWTASGGIFYGPQRRIIGEDGPEAVVPLDRDLSRVDPAVRALSAFAQGLAMPGGGGGGGKTVNVGGLTVLSPSADPRVVAMELLNHLAARAI